MPIEPSAIGVWVWKQYGKDIAFSTLGALKAGWKRFKWPEAEQKYKNRLKELYSMMRVLFRAETVPLNDLYIDLFVLEEPEAFRRYGADHLESEFEDLGGFFNRSERSSALRVVSQIDHLFVLGKPGAGKTTLLKHLTTLASEEKIDKVPIFISFNNWAVSQKELVEFIIEQFDICGFPNAKSFIDVLLSKGNAILLFDGLDEVSEENNLRDRLIYDVEKLISRYPTNKFVITCRNAANEYQFDGFTYVEIADFSDKQVNIFVNKWFGDNSQKAHELTKALADIKHQNLRELSHNPLLLGMLCLVYESTSNFPVKRGEIYQDAIDALLKRWDKQRGIQRDKISGFSPEIENHLLSFLAYDYFLENKIFFEQNDLQNKTSRLLNPLLDGVVDSETIINAIEVQDGLLAKRAHRIYTFSHLTFQEYFTARYIIDQLNTTDKSLNELFRHFYNSRWREVFLLTSSLLPSADRFFKIFNSHIRNSVKKDKQLIYAISWSNSLSINFKKEISHINKRMVSIALVISIGRIVGYLQTITEKRDQELVSELIENLNLDEIDVDESTISEIIRVVIRNIPFSSELAERFKSLVKLSIKRSSEFDFTE